MANQILAGAVIQAGMVIAGVDANNPPYVGPPQPKSWNFDNEHNHSTYVLVDAHGGMKLSETSGWTLEFWAKFDGNPGQENIIEWSNGHHISITEWTGGNEFKFNTGSNNRNFAFSNNGSFPSLWTTGASGSWTHVALVGVPNVSQGNTYVTISLFLDGVKHPQTFDSFETFGTSGNTQIGKYLDGSMFDFRMSSTPRYTADFTAPTDLLPVDANVTLSTLRYETLSDESTYGSSVSVVGDFGVEPVPQENYPFSPPPANVDNMTADDWTTVGGSVLQFNPGGNANAEIHWTPGGSRPSTSVAYYEIANMLPGESYELTFEVKLAAYSGPVGVEVHQNSDQSSLMASVYANGGYQSQTLSWTQPAGLTEAYIHLVSQTNGMGEMRDAVLTKVS